MTAAAKKRHVRAVAMRYREDHGLEPASRRPDDGGLSLDDIFRPSRSTDALLAAIEASEPWADELVLAGELGSVIGEHWASRGLDAMAVADIAGTVRDAAAAGLRNPLALAFVAWKGLSRRDMLERHLRSLRSPRLRPSERDDGPVIPERTRRHYRRMRGARAYVPVLDRIERDGRIEHLMSLTATGS